MLALNNPDFDYSALDRTDLANGTRRHYKAAIALLLASNVNPFEYTELANYAASLPSSGRSNLKAALSIISRDYVNKAKMSNAPVETIQRFLWMVEAMNDAIVITQPSTERAPHWLSQEQINTILQACNTRDGIVMGVLLGAGLRREELETLTFESLTQIPHNGKMVDVLRVLGKGDKVRTIQISASLAHRIHEWEMNVGSGRIARSLGKTGKIGEGLSAIGIFRIVRKHGLTIGIDDLDPHDCRRSYGRLLYESTGDIMLVKNALGHESVRTTQKYIGLDINLDLEENVFPV
jgi:site-specific recombinase XerC